MIYGLRWIGSKRQFLRSDTSFFHFKDKIVIDVFGGGGSLSHYALEHGARFVIYNEINPEISYVVKMAFLNPNAKDDPRVQKQFSQFRQGTPLLKGEQKIMRFEDFKEKPSYKDKGLNAVWQQYNQLNNMFNCRTKNNLAFKSYDCYDIIDEYRYTKEAVFMLDPPFSKGDNKKIYGKCFDINKFWEHVKEKNLQFYGFDNIPHPEFKELCNVRQSFCGKIYNTFCFSNGVE